MSIATKIYSKLPEQIKDLLVSPELVDSVERIAEKQKLNPKYYGDIYNVTASLLSGEITPVEFVSRLSEEIDCTREQAALIAVDINRDIFSPIKDALREVHTKKDIVQKLDPSLVTCLPGQMSKAAALGNKAPGNAPMGNILEQKLAGSFRMKGDTILTDAMPAPRLVVPPPPQVQMPPTSPQSERPPYVPPAHHPTEPPKADPYRSHDLS